MSHTLHETVDIIPEEGMGGQPYPPQSAPAQAPQGESNFADGSGDIFLMYLKMATEEDKKMADNWTADADGILIFTGLFSAAVASLISVSIQDIRQDPQDTSNFYLAHIYQTLADPNRPNISSSLPFSPPPFSPPTYAVWVNALWFLSLVISLTCALLVTLLRQWARRYLKVTQPRYALHKRARIRAFLAEGVDNCFLPWTVEALPTLLHISLFLFFAGLVLFLWNVDLTIFKLVLSWVGICMGLYGCITVMPIFRHDSPYLTPLSLPAWHIVTGVSFLRILTFRALRRLTVLEYFGWETYVRFRDLAERYSRWLLQGMQKTVEETAFSSPPEIDTRAFLWTFDSSDEDHELERFYSGLPGFRGSKVVPDPLPGLAEERKEGLFTALSGLLDRTLSSDLLPVTVKNRRAIICARAIDPAHTTEALGFINVVLSKYQYGHPLVAEIVQIVRGWEINMDGDAILDAKATFSLIVARVQPHDDTWFILASKSLGVPEDVLRGYAAHGDSPLLAVLIHGTRQQFIHFREPFWPWVRFSEVLEEASKIDVFDTLSGLQHEFCALWNQIVRKVQTDNDRPMAFYTLGRIRNVYLALHQNTDCAPTQFSASTGNTDIILLEPSIYPTCNVPGHHPDSTPHIHDDSASATFAPVVLHENVAPLPVPLRLAGTPHAPSLFVPAPHNVGETLVYVPLLNNNMSVSTSFYPAHQATMVNPRSPGTSPDPVVAGATRDIDTFPRMCHLFTPESSAFTSPPKRITLTPPPDPATIEYTADYHTPLGDLDVSSSPSPTPVPDGMLSTEFELPLPLPVPGAPGPSRPWLSSTPDLSAAAKGEGSAANTALRKEKNAPYHSSTICDDMANPDLSLRSPSPSSVTDVIVAGRSHSSFYIELTGDHPPRPLRCH